MKFTTQIVYCFNDILNRLFKLKILSTDDSIDMLIQEEISLARYGDGELNIMMGGDIHFQNYDKNLEKRLREIIHLQNDSFKIGIPLAINSTRGYNKDADEFWKMNMATGRMHWFRLCGLKRTYLNASLTRCFLDYEDKKKSIEWFLKILQLWEDKDILIVEGKKSRLGVDNGLFVNARRIERVICSSENAYACYERISEKTISFAEDKDMVLISLGPTATVLAYDLYQNHIRGIDIGHLNLEYNMYLKQTNQYDKNCISEEQYQKQIIQEIY